MIICHYFENQEPYPILILRFNPCRSDRMRNLQGLRLKCAVLECRFILIVRYEVNYLNLIIEKKS